MIPSEQIIDPRELRIGNYLEYDGKIVHVTMLSMDIDDEYEEQICFCELGKTNNEKGGWNRAICNRLNRIPITHNWLIKLGAENEVYDEQWVLYRIGFFLFKLHQEYGLCQWGAEKQEILLGTVHYKYIHQLQNLIFALSGMELKLQP